MSIVATADRREVFRDDGHVSVRSWVKASIRAADHDVTQRVRTARLCADRAGVPRRLAAGRLGVAQVRELARAHANPRCGDQLAAVVDELVDLAETHHPRGVRPGRAPLGAARRRRRRPPRPRGRPRRPDGADGPGRGHRVSRRPCRRRPVRGDERGVRPVRPGRVRRRVGRAARPGSATTPARACSNAPKPSAGPTPWPRSSTGPPPPTPPPRIRNRSSTSSSTRPCTKPSWPPWPPVSAVQFDPDRPRPPTLPHHHRCPPRPRRRRHRLLRRTRPPGRARRRRA